MIDTVKFSRVDDSGDLIVEAKDDSLTRKTRGISLWDGFIEAEITAEEKSILDFIESDDRLYDPWW